MLNRNTYPHIREATDADYEAIWDIWMQDHVIQWMSFVKKDIDTFRNHYNRMAAASTIYVLVDKIDHGEKIVAVQRIKFLVKNAAHCAEYCSLGVSKKFQGKGYAKKIHVGFEEICRAKGIKRIQLTQSGGNHAAFHIGDLSGFRDEAIFPDWLKREKNDGSYYLIERYRYRFIDDKLTAMSENIPTLQFDETVPSLVSADKSKTEDRKIVKEGDLFCYMVNEKKILEVAYEPDNSVIQHIAFLTINFANKTYMNDTVLAMCSILQSILNERRVIKCEIFVSEPLHAKICQLAGFFVRGEKRASLYVEGRYKNELGCEYSFLGINDARLLIRSQLFNANLTQQIVEKLEACEKTIHILAEENKYSQLGCQYLENIVYQITRDSIKDEFVISLNSTERIERLYKQLPEALIISLIELSEIFGKLGVKPAQQTYETHSRLFSSQHDMPFHESPDSSNGTLNKKMSGNRIKS